MLAISPLLLVLALTADGSAGAAHLLAPLPAGQWTSTHGPFEMGACNACHDPSDPKAPPGRLRKASNALCFDCHDDYSKPMKGHPSPEDVCVVCHSPHNAKKRKLLLK